MAVPMANDPPFATLNHFAADLGIPSESDLLRIGIRNSTQELPCLNLHTSSAPWLSIWSGTYRAAVARSLAHRRIGSGDLFLGVAENWVPLSAAIAIWKWEVCASQANPRQT